MDCENGADQIHDLGGAIRVKTGDWKESFRIDIRSYKIKDDKEIPTTDGVSLTRDQYMMFRKHFTEITNSLDHILLGGGEINLRIHLGGDYYITLNSPYKGFNIRKWFTPKETTGLLPGKGLFFKCQHFRRLLSVDANLNII